MRSWIDLDPREKADPRLLHAWANNLEEPQSTFIGRKVWESSLWVVTRCSIIDEQRATGISSPRSDQHAGPNTTGDNSSSSNRTCLPKNI